MRRSPPVGSAPSASRPISNLAAFSNSLDAWRMVAGCQVAHLRAAAATSGRGWGPLLQRARLLLAGSNDRSPSCGCATLLARGPTAHASRATLPRR